MKNSLLIVALFVSVIAVCQSPKVIVPYREGKLWGYCDTLGKVLVRPFYDSTGFTEGNYAFVYKAGKCGLVNSAGLPLIKPAYSKISSYSDGYLVYQGAKVGYVTGKGKLILPVIYDKLYFATDNYMILEKANKYGISNMTGTVVLPVLYDKIITSFSSAKADDNSSMILVKGDNYFLFDYHTAKLKAFDGRDIEDTDMEGVMDTGPYPDGNYTEKYGKEIKEKLQADEVTPLNFTTLYNSGGFFLVKKNGKMGVIKYNSPKLPDPFIPIIYDTITHITDNSGNNYTPVKSQYLVSVSNNGSFGVVNENGDTIIPFDYDWIGPFKNYYNGFELQRAGKKGLYLPTTFYPVITPRYEEISFQTSMYVNETWSFAIYKVVKDGRYGFIGENGREFFK